MLTGTMKVSALAMGLFLKQTLEYELALVCANKPTHTLLNEIHRELTMELDKQVTSPIQSISTGESWMPITYQVDAHRDDASLTVQCGLLPQHTIRIRFTSPVFSTEQPPRSNGKSPRAKKEANRDPPDMLSRIKCLEALAAMGMLSDISIRRRDMTRKHRQSGQSFCLRE
jgi:hypothetical protein